MGAFDNFAGLVPTLQAAADRLQNRLGGVERMLARLVDSAESEANMEQYSSRSNEGIAPASKELDLTFNIDQNELWKVQQVGITGAEGGTTQCQVYLGAVAPQNLIDVFSPTGKAAGRASYLIPVNGVLIFHFVEQTAGTLCTVNILFERYQIGAEVDANTGRTNERLEGEAYRMPDEVPSGDPLSEVQIP